MQSETYFRRVRQIYRMLFEMATGNLGFRIAYEGFDEIARLEEALNKFAAQMQLSIRKSGSVQPYYNYENVIHWAILLDPNFKILALSTNALHNLETNAAALRYQSLEELLTPNSRLGWQQIKQEAMNPDFSEKRLQIEFLSGNGKITPVHCLVSKLLGADHYLISSVTTLTEEIAGLNQNAKALPTESILAQRLYEYIMANLDKPLPTIPRLAAMFDTNETKLKEGFKHYFNQGIHHFYNEERLKRAQLIIAQSDFSLKAVAFMSGFNDYITFSKAFRKKFGYGPGQVLRLKR